MAQMKAKRAFRYAGRRLAVGDAFDTRSDRDAVLLEAAGRATRTNQAEEKAEKVAKRRGRPPKQAAEPESRTVMAEEAQETATFTDEERSRFYNRRDMQAEDE